MTIHSFFENITTDSYPEASLAISLYLFSRLESTSPKNWTQMSAFYDDICKRFSQKTRAACFDACRRLCEAEARAIFPTEDALTDAKNAKIHWQTMAQETIFSFFTQDERSARVLSAIIVTTEEWFRDVVFEHIPAQDRVAIFLECPVHSLSSLLKNNDMTQASNSET